MQETDVQTGRTIRTVTYQSIIRTYARDVRAGSADRDLTPRQRRLVEVLLNTASSSPWATGQYPPSEDDRRRVCQAFGDVQWNGNTRALMLAVGPAADADFTVALELTLEILRNV
jgi:hypothetical protein